MSNTLLIKRSSTPGAVPATANLALGELAVNTYDGRLFTKLDTGSPSVYELTQNQPITVSGNVIGTSVNGTGNTNITLTLSTTGVTAGTYGGTSGASSNVGVFTVDQYGRVTSASNVTISTSSLANGTANIQIFSSGNIALSPAGTSNVAVFASTGEYVTGLLSVTGNIIGANVNTGIVSASGNVIGGNITTGGLVSATGNLTGGNVTTGGLISATGNLTAGNIITGGLITATGTIQATNIQATSNVSGSNINGGNIYASGGVTLTGQVNAAGNITGGNLISNAAVLSTTVSASGNVTGGNILTTGLVSATGNVTGNYILGNGALLTGVITSVANINNGTSNVSIATANANITVSVNGTSNVAVFATTGEYVTGVVSASGNVTGSNIVTGGLVTATGNVTGSNIVTGGLVTATGNITGGNILTAGLISATGNITAGNVNGGANVYATTHTGATVSVTGNVNGGNLISAALVQGVTVSASGNVIGGNVTTSGLISASGSITGAAISGTTVSGSGNVTGANLITGGLITATGTITGGNLATAGTASAGGNITGANLITGGLVTATGNVTSGNVNTAGQVSAGGNVTAGNVTTGGLISATGNVSGANFTAGGFVTASGNVTGSNVITTGSVITPNVTSSTGGLTIGTAGGNLSLLPTTGNIVVNTYINGLLTPQQATDAATKAYVDNAVSSGLTIHTPVLLESPNTAGSLNATYADGGTTQTVTTISGSKTLTFGSSPALAVNDIIVFSSTANGLTAGTAYFVYSTNGTNQVTLSSSYNGLEITTLTNGTGLSIGSRANSGVGATLTNAGANAALTIDGVLTTVGNRVLIYNQTSAFQNGVYTVTTVGNGSTPWVLTRSTDTNKYGEKSITTLDIGDYFFVQSGNSGAGESYVVTAPEGTIVFGTTNIVFTQFSASQVYTANASAGLTLVGTVFNAKVDNTTTAFDGSGNIIVKASAQLTTPNIGAATGTSLSVTGNVTGGNLVTGGAISSTGNITGGNILGGANVNATTHTGATVSVTGNINGGNLISAALVQGVTVSASGNVVGGNVNTAGLISATGNITGGNLSGTNITGTLATASQTNITGVGNITTGTWSATAVGLAYGGTGKTTAPAAIAALMGYTSTATAAGTTTLTNTSSYYQQFTGTSTQTVVLPVTSTLQTGWTFHIVNNSTGNLTVQSSGLNTVITVIPGTTAMVTCVSTATTTAADWEAGLTDFSTYTGTGAVVLGTSPTLTTPNIGAATGTSLSVTANVTGGNITTAGVVTATGNINGGNLISAALVQGVTVSASGNVVGGNLTTGAQVVATGNITGGNLLTGGLISATGNITGGNIITTGIGTIGTLNITTLGNITSTTVSTTTTTGALKVAGGVGVVGNIYAGSLYSAGEAVLTVNSTVDGGTY